MKKEILVIGLILSLSGCSTVFALSLILAKPVLPTFKVTPPDTKKKQKGEENESRR